MEGKSAEALWQDYRFLTKEMFKFLTKQDMELFYELTKQRERLQTIIDQTVDDGFKATSAGRSLLSEIQQDSQEIMHNLQLRLGSSKRQHQVSEAYSSASTTAVSEMNWKR
jgi:polyhydroxyalkanoate synthesis regulator phasin